MRKYLRKYSQLPKWQQFTITLAATVVVMVVVAFLYSILFV